MRLYVATLCVLAAAAAAAELPTAYDYHERIGIPEAARIKAVEEARDFDGSRIVGGSPANLGRYPHVGGLIIELTGAFYNLRSVCGSSLLSNTRLVTAANCWWDGRHLGREMTVVLGSERLYSGGTRVRSSRVLMHAGWSPSALAHNIAIVVIDRVEYTSFINRIAIATGSNNFIGHWAVAVGFGRTSDASPIDQHQMLHHVSVQVISNTVCAMSYFGTVTNAILCTSGAGARGTCSGDHGGPLQVANTLIGVSSFRSGSGCTRGHPSGFSRVSFYAAWISARL